MPGVAKTHWIRLPAREEQKSSEANTNTGQRTTPGPPSTTSVTAPRQHPEACAWGPPRQAGTLWTTRAEAHATNTEQQLVSNAEAPFAEWLSGHGIAERRANVRRVAAMFGQKGGRAGMTRGTKVVVWASARARTSRHPPNLQCFFQWTGPSRNARLHFG